MTEKEKMLAGELYDPGDKELSADRERCKDLCHELNMTMPSHNEKIKKILSEILGKTKENFCFTAPFYCDYGYNIEVGEWFYANHGLVILDCAKVKIGDCVLIGPNCGIYTAAHPLDAETRNTGLEYALPITIEDNVWIGGGVQIMPGVTIGKNSVIGAGSVVTKSVPADCVAAGNPARVIKHL